MIPCPIKAITGYDCPGCGMQRSIMELLHGNLAESILLYPALFPLVAMFVFLMLHLKFEFKKGHIVLKFFFIINVAIIIISYFCKIFNFDLL
ncbi:MAG: DUF2752 domain-containing protein [Bacteroidales bacterium]|nr:DUF2752 domain-containing protein [Bacteroidales bacterium]